MAPACARPGARCHAGTGKGGMLQAMRLSLRGDNPTERLALVAGLVPDAAAEAWAGMALSGVLVARDYGHLTARQAGRIAAEARARLLVLTHFSQRYEHHPRGVQLLADEAAEAFGGPVVLAGDLDRIPVPPRPPAPDGAAPAPGG